MEIKIAQAWEVELAQKLDDLECGKTQTIDADEALARIDARLRGR